MTDPDIVARMPDLLDRYTVIVDKEEEREGLRLLHGRIFNEIDCRIEHGAESNGHLEAIRNLFEKSKEIA